MVALCATNIRDLIAKTGLPFSGPVDRGAHVARWAAEHQPATSGFRLRAPGWRLDRATKRATSCSSLLLL
jgi:hypothetical protein